MKNTGWLLVAGATLVLFLSRKPIVGSAVQSMKRGATADLEKKHPWVHWAYTSVYGDEDNP